MVGVTFECDYPDEARAGVTDRVDPGDAGGPVGPREIDAAVVEAMSGRGPLPPRRGRARRHLGADLVVTQDLCAVCAVDVSVVDDALAHLGCTAEVLTIDPRTLDDVLESILTLGRATGHEPEAAATRGATSASASSAYDGVGRRRTGPG